MAHLIDLKAVKKSYQLGKTDVVALQGVDLSVDAGEFTVVTGPSGSGKTTLLNIIGCLDRASAGRYALDGVDVSNRDFDDLVADAVEMREEKVEVDLAAARLVAAGVVGDLDVADALDVRFQRARQITGDDLCVVDVVLQFHIAAVDRLQDWRKIELEGLANRAKGSPPLSRAELQFFNRFWNKLPFYNDQQHWKMDDY